MSITPLKVFTLPAILTLHGKVFQMWLAMNAKMQRNGALALKRIFLMLNVSKMIIDCTKCKEIFHVTGTIPVKTFKKVGSKHEKTFALVYMC